MAMRVQHDIVRELAAGVLDGAYIEGDSPVSGRDDEYGPAVRQAAFTLWAYEAGKSIPVARRMLKERTGLDVDAGARVRGCEGTRVRWCAVQSSRVDGGEG